MTFMDFLRFQPVYIIRGNRKGRTGMSGSQKIRVGVVGVGYLGEHHARVYSTMDGVDLVGVVDTNRQRADEIALRYDTKALYDYHELFDQNVDCVSIVVPTTAHFPVSMDFVRNGIDVLIEKPITTSVEDAEALIHEATKRNVLIQVGHLERFNSAFMALRKIVKEPRFIEVHRIGPYVGRGIDVDVILDLMIHDIDIILSLVRSEIEEIRAVGVPVLTDHIDIANARIEFANGCIANITASRVSRDKMRKLRVFQHDAYITVDYGKQNIRVYRRIEQNGGPTITCESIDLGSREPLAAELEAFIRAVRDRSEPVISGRDGKEALRVATMIGDAARQRLCGA